MKGQSNVNDKLFINQFEHWVKHDLPNALDHIRVALSSIKNMYLKKVADHIQDFISQHNNSEYI